MKKIIILVCIIFSYLCMGQVGIGTTTPNSSSVLDLDVSSITPKKGFLPPRVNLTSNTDASTIASPPTGMLVYNKTASGSGNTLIKANSLVVWNSTIWESISNLPEIRTLKTPIDYVLSSKTQQDFSVAELASINLSQPVTVPWQSADVYVNNTSDIQLTGNTLTFLTDSYYQISGALNFKVNVLVAGNSSQVIVALQSSSNNGLLWNTIFSNSTPIEKNAANKTQTISFPNFIHHFSSNDLLRVVIYKPAAANSYVSSSGVLVNVPGTDITKTFRIIRIQQ
ncbi:hypothetical protein [Chryseobacterium sp. SIMBA_029]|uniref:hypothetical protein n=1 Tax=Chryseobacterium sp. SIMBA_029 TaxID=3085772 RepID=UPI00397CC553